MRTCLLIAASLISASVVAAPTKGVTQPPTRKIILGKLGQALTATKIYSRPGKNSHVYYSVKPYEYLVLQSSNSDSYYKVLLSNRAWGYVPVDNVARLPYDVKQDVPTYSARDNSVLASRGGGHTLSNANSRAAIAAYAQEFKGTPYKWGGNDPLKGIDCSGFVKFLYGQIGVSLPRTAAEQVYVGVPITRLQDLQAGDRLYFWSNKRNKVGHTGIYLGNGYFCHSSTNHKGVATDYLGTKHWLGMLVAARR